MLLPISKQVKYKKAGDCKLVLFSHLLGYYGIEIPPSDIIVAGAGLDFEIFQYQVGAKRCFFLVGRRLQLEENFANLIGVNLQKKTYECNDVMSNDMVMEKCKYDIMHLLDQGHPLYFMLDRFYLSYIHMNRSHMPYHTIIAIGYDKSKQEVYAIDSLQEDMVTISFDILIKAMFEPSIMKTKSYAQIYYIGEENLRNLKEYSIVEGLLQQKEYFFSVDGALDNMCTVTDFLDGILKKIDNNKNPNYLNYIKYQVALLYTEIHDQDFEHLFYRNLYFGRVKSFLREYGQPGKRNEQLSIKIDDSIETWRRLANTRQFGQKFELDHVVTLIDSLRCIYKKEKELFEYIGELFA